MIKYLIAGIVYGFVLGVIAEVLPFSYLGIAFITLGFLIGFFAVIAG